MQLNDARQAACMATLRYLEAKFEQGCSNILALNDQT